MYFIENLRSITKVFKEHSIKYCLAGGFAIIHYGVVRGTQDLDFFIAVDTTDCERILRVLQKSLVVQRWEIRSGLLQVYINDMRIDIMPHVSIAESRLVNNAVNKNVYGVRCRIARIEDLLLLKQSIASEYEPRHQMDVELISRDCKKFINTRYLKEGIKELNMEMYAPYFEKLLGRKLF